jgi:hypothetical protein
MCIKNKLNLVRLGWLAILLSISVAAQAEALLDNRFTLQLGGETVTFYPDMDSKYQYYYLPLKPRLATKKHGNLGQIPQFQFLKYNFAVRNAGLSQGGILQMALTVSLPNGLLDEAKAKIAELKGLQQKRIRIGMVNIVEAQLDFAVSGGEGGKFVTSYLGQGPSIRHAGEVAPVVIDLTPEGAAVYKKMMTGSAGLAVNYSYSYIGYTPEIEVKVSGDWNKVYEHYSRSSQARATVKFWWYKASFEGNWQKVREDLVDQADIKIEWITKPDPRDPNGKRLIQLIEESILMRITEAVLTKEPPAPDEKPVAPAKADLKEGWLGGFAYAVNVKDVKKRRRGHIRFHYKSNQKIRVSGNRTGNAIGVKPANDAVKDMMFVEVEKDKFFNSLKINTSAGGINPRAFGILSLKYVLIGGDTTIEQVYVPDRRGRNLVPIDAEEEFFSSVYFANPHSKYRMSYYVELTTQQKTKIKTIKSCQALDLPSNGVAGLSFTPELLGIDFVELDAAEVVFREDAEEDDTLEPDTLPKYITGKLKQGKRQLRFKIKVDDEPVVWPICTNGIAVKARILAKGYKEKPRKRQYIYNERDLFELPDGLTLYLSNEDFSRD